jgi:hypothetical protein
MSLEKTKVLLGDHVIHVLDYTDYNQQQLLDEAHSRQYEPFVARMDDKNSDPKWFENGRGDIHMNNWTQARFFEKRQDGSDHLINYPETKRITEYFASIIQTNDIRPRYYKLEANTCVPEHVDHNTKCGINIILNESAGPVEFVDVGQFEYQVALLNTSRLHRVPAYPQERILLKMSIMDIDFGTVKRRLLNAI